MMHYRKGENIEQELSKDDLPFNDCLTKLPQKDFLWMHVRGGTKVHNVLSYAKNALDKGEYRTVVWSGSGGGVVKTVSCAEIFKRSFPLYQLTRMDQVTIEEHWEPQMEGLDPIVAKRKVPSLHILMTLDPIDESISDVQKPNTTTEYWRESNGNENGIGGGGPQAQKQPRRNGPNTNNGGQTPRQRQNQRPLKQSRPDQTTQNQDGQQEQSENNPNATTPRERQQRPQNLKRSRNDPRKARGEHKGEQQSQQACESQQQRNGGEEQQRHHQQSQRQRRPKPKQRPQQQQSPQSTQAAKSTESTTTATNSSSSATVGAVPMES